MLSFAQARVVWAIVEEMAHVAQQVAAVDTGEMAIDVRDIVYANVYVPVGGPATITDPAEQAEFAKWVDAALKTAGEEPQPGSVLYQKESERA